MPRYVQGSSRDQATLLPECVDDYTAEDNPIRVVEGLVEQWGLEKLGFERTTPASTGRPSYHPTVLFEDLKIYIYGT